MSEAVSRLTDSGLEVIDLLDDASFAGRTPRIRDQALEMEAMRRIAHAFVEEPETVLQELVNAAVQLCGAESAGISIEKNDGSEKEYYQWVATAGVYSNFFNAILPQYPSACGVCLERGRPQIFRVGRRFFELMGIDAPLVTDGILLPWRVENTRGTIFIMAHGRTEAFDSNDSRLMQVLANFVATGVRQQSLQKVMLQHAAAAAESAMANRLAHQINNPLQSLMNILYLAASGEEGRDAKEVGRASLEDLLKLSALVEKLLALPGRASGCTLHPAVAPKMSNAHAVS